ncbi:ribosomal L11 methyltransferase [Thermaerobacter marianensis DSM 12885]|uniref:Ribosomal protein L11 methyltransferase n=1 Tax=Thermaerobacter marianensis (strain ATCC 700841 / DSM 12885 / JCM 10246 / 7p75a) TaxID=644966 RepID=E6SKA5_THEM7|nr:50S ribosomal protein L11 methyltransferase [Thermaerobacter marianensis]ADU52263.1 ribosomal L11 methyltransferase [Thermaerobacter marianensis DSM 12885]
MRWLEMVIDVPAQAAEAAAAALLDVVGAGLAWEEREGTVRLRAYLPEEGFEERYRQLGERWRRVRQVFPAVGPWAPAVRARAEEEWAEAWKAYFQPLPVGRRLLVVPSWLRDRTDAGPRIPLILDPGMAFGTGQHASTRLALELLEEALDAMGRAPEAAGSGDALQGPGESRGGAEPTGGPAVAPGDGEPGAGVTVLDVGTGSGILAIAAALLGARPVLGIDVDPVAVKVARENAAVNGVADRVQVAGGTPADLRRQPPAGWSGHLPAAVTVANITAEVLAGMLDDLTALTRPGGVLILSGLLAGAPDTRDLEERGRALGWHVADRRQAEGWEAWRLRRRRT